jgi:ribosome maturation factor RimP
MERLLSAWGYELVLMRYMGQPRSGHLRLLIDKPGGITISDCEMVSKQVGAYLDVVDPIPQRYTLEVSSPGLNRPLTKDGDLEASLGKRVSLRLTALSGGSRRMQGVLKGIGKETLQMEIDGRILEVAREKILEATLMYDWQEEDRSQAGHSKGRRGGAGRGKAEALESKVPGEAHRAEGREK